MMVDQGDIHEESSEPQPKLHTLYEYYLQMDRRSKLKAQNNKTFRSKHKWNFCVLGLTFLGMTSKALYTKRKKIDK